MKPNIGNVIVTIQQAVRTRKKSEKNDNVNGLRRLATPGEKQSGYGNIDGRWQKVQSKEDGGSYGVCNYTSHQN
jgi:hypothetical protein